MRASRLIFVLAALILMTGCAAGHRIDYRQAVPIVNIATESQVSVLVIDDRSYVTAGRKSANYVGNSRALYYNPFRITTASGNSLAVDLQVAIVNGLQRNGVKATHRAVVDEGSEHAEQRLLLVTIREWKVDAYMRVRFDYDITASVQDERGKTLGSSHTKGRTQINNFLTSGGNVLSAVIDDPSVKSALVGKTAKKTAKQPLVVQTTQSNSAYDNCMARVIRISDSALRLKAMSACDSAQ